MKVFTIGLMAAVLCGCTGKLYTIVNPDIPEGEEYKIQGVLTYSAINVVEVYRTTARTDQSGNQIATAAEGTCLPDTQIKFSTRTDYNSPHIIVYERGFFETGKFALTLDKGTLVSVNTDSNMPDIVPEIANLMPFVRAPRAAEGAVPEGRPLCNAAPRLEGVYMAPETWPFSEMNL